MNNKLLSVSLICVSLIVLAGCSFFDESSEKTIDTSWHIDAEQHYGRLIHISEFPEEKIIESTIVASLAQANTTSISIGSVPENALVPLIIDDAGYLYTPKRYNTELDAITDDSEVGQWVGNTDLVTFSLITGLPEAQADYARPLPGGNGQAVWFFDPYAKFYKKRDPQSLRFSTPSITAFNRIQGTSWNQLGNIIFGKWDSDGVSDYLGHTGGVSQSYTTSTNPSTLMSNTKTIEASNQGKSLAAVSIGTEDGVFERFMSSTGYNYWNHSSVYSRVGLWYPYMTNSQRNQIVQYMKSQLGENYSFSSKSNTSSWYCSKLQWRAYKQVLNIDIDYDGGSYVFPEDILYSDLLVGVSF